MRHLLVFLFLALSHTALVACGAVTDSESAKVEEGECTVGTPAPPLDNTAELDTSAQGGGS